MDSGIDRRVVPEAAVRLVAAWLLREFPARPLPTMLKLLGEGELERFRDELRERLRALTVP